MDTIAAIATPKGAGGIGIIRISGKDALTVAKKLFAPISPSCAFLPRKMYLGQAKFGDVSDKALMVYFKAPYSYTGEDVVEFHLHGGRYLVEKGLKSVLDAGARLAEAGEFTKTAFINGKLALSDAEGVIDIINADSEAAVKAAYRLLNGELSQKVFALQDELLTLTASLEAALDYPEELLDDVDKPAIESTLQKVKGEIFQLLNTANTGKMIKEGASVAIIGSANAGKSSLLNKILKCDRAIVSDIEGTTRDTIEESVVYKGVKLNFIDTAGMRESTDTIEKIGVERSKNAVKGADITLVLVDGTRELTENDKKIIAEYGGKHTVLCVNKTDENTVVKVENAMMISAKTGDGVNELLDKVLEMLDLNVEDAAMITDARHEAALKKAFDFLGSAINSIYTVPTDCLMVDIRGAYFALGEITGNSASEDITDTVFKKFCVGK